jgi:Protein of unknown function (DUF2950)
MKPDVDRNPIQAEMEQAMMTRPASGDREQRPASTPRTTAAAFLTAALFVLGATGGAMAADQQTFASPEEAAKALIAAARNDDTQALLSILGPDSEQLVQSGDDVADKAAATAFAAKAEKMMRIDQGDDGKEVLTIGNDAWPFPIPIVKKGDAWAFDTDAGLQEILNRRIGANELDTIDVCHAYVDAQRQYASADRDDSGVLKFAQRFASSEGKHDGLYWPANNNEEASPFGPLVADAVAEGYSGQKTTGPQPYHGYLYRILTAQGQHAPGGAYSYIINGNMIAGFAMIAYPARYGGSGVMTFIVNQQGIVYQKDLGTKTAQLANAIKRYDPDSSWQKAE